MKNKIIGIFVCVLLITTVLPVLGNTEKVELPMSIGGDNLVPNPSFEEGAGDMPTGWGHTCPTPDVEYIWDSKHAHSGNKSIGLANNSRLQWTYFWFTIEYIPVDISLSYSVSVSYKCIGYPAPEQDVYIVLSSYDKNLNILNSPIWFLPYNGDELWHYVCFDCPVGRFDSSTKFVAPRLGISALGKEVFPFEIRFDDVFFGLGVANNRPAISKLEGPTSGRAGVSYTYTVSAIDPDNDDVYYWFDWGDGTNSGWIGSYVSGEEVERKHTWMEGNYTIQVKAKDTHGAENDWSEIVISMPKSFMSNTCHQNILDSYRNKEIIVYCKDGERSEIAIEIL